MRPFAHPMHTFTGADRALLVPACTCASPHASTFIQRSKRRGMRMGIHRRVAASGRRSAAGRTPSPSASWCACDASTLRTRFPSVLVLRASPPDGAASHQLHCTGKFDRQSSPRWQCTSSLPAAVLVAAETARAEVRCMRGTGTLGPPLYRRSRNDTWPAQGRTWRCWRSLCRTQASGPRDARGSTAPSHRSNDRTR